MPQNHNLPPAVFECLNDLQLAVLVVFFFFWKGPLFLCILSNFFIFCEMCWVLSFPSKRTKEETKRKKKRMRWI